MQLSLNVHPLLDGLKGHRIRNLVFPLGFQVVPNIKDLGFWLAGRFIRGLAESWRSPELNLRLLILFSLRNWKWGLRLLSFSLIDRFSGFQIKFHEWDTLLQTLLDVWKPGSG
jgi:hypothetical protein